MTWNLTMTNDDVEEIDFTKSWKDNIPESWEENRIEAYGLKGGDMQCGIQEVVIQYDDREDTEVSPAEADKIVSFLDEDDMEALKRAWAGEASDEWRDLVTEAKTLLGLKDGTKRPCLVKDQLRNSVHHRRQNRSDENIFDI